MSCSVVHEWSHTDATSSRFICSTSKHRWQNASQSRVSQSQSISDSGGKMRTEKVGKNENGSNWFWQQVVHLISLFKRCRSRVQAPCSTQLINTVPKLYPFITSFVNVTSSSTMHTVACPSQQMDRALRALCGLCLRVPGERVGRWSVVFVIHVTDADYETWC